VKLAACNCGVAAGLRTDHESQCAGLYLHSDTDAPHEKAAKPARKTKFSATKAALAECKKRGWHAGIVERRIHFGGRQAHGNWRDQTTIDLFGCIDLVVLQDDDSNLKSVQIGNQICPGYAGVLGIQATSSSSDSAARRKKIDQLLELQDSEVMAWLRCGNRLEVWSWNKHQKKNKETGSVREWRELTRWSVKIDRSGKSLSRELWIWDQVEEGA